MLDALIKTIRPKQWYKNFVIFIAIVFSGNLLNPSLWVDSLTAFVGFCLIAGSVYIINDIVDVDKDRQHPIKKNRPIASGALKVSHALMYALFLLFASLTIAILVNYQLSLVALSYFVVFLFYSLYLKNMVAIDIITISVGFVMRAIAGAIAIDVFFSPWLAICTFLLAMYLALGKRRHEILLLGDNATSHRKILDDYSIAMLEQMISIITASLIVSYSLYTFFSGGYYMMLTIPLAVYGIFRYLFLIHSSDIGGEPEMLFEDRGMVGCMLLWIFMVMLIVFTSSPGSGIL